MLLQHSFIYFTTLFYNIVVLSRSQYMVMTCHSIETNDEVP